MAGAAADRELSHATATRFARATTADDSAIRRLLRETPVRGAISITFEREPDYFRGAGMAGADDETIVAFSNGRIVCMGRCSRRLCWLDGQARRVGYLAELRLADAARGRFRILRDGYRFFEESQGEDAAGLYFTSIGAENERAWRLLEKGARGLPAYGFLAEFATLLVAVPRRPARPRLRVEPATPDRVQDLVRILNGQARREQLGAVWTAESVLALGHHGLPLNRFVVALRGDDIVGCGAFWDQREFRQTVIRGYTPALAALRPLVNFASRLIGSPRLPPPGSVLRCAFLSPIAFSDGTEAMLPDLVEAFFPLASESGIEFLALGLPAEDTRLPALRRRFSTRTWRSRLYRVDWPGRARFEIMRPEAAFVPDVALL